MAHHGAATHDAQAVAASRRRHWRLRTGIRWRAAIIVLAGFLAYANSFSGPFVLDDRVSIVENAQIRDVWRLESVLFPRRELPTAGRPLVNFSFAVNYALGGLNVGGYHLVNLAFHLLCGLLVFGIVRRTLELPALKDRFGAVALESRVRGGAAVDASSAEHRSGRLPDPADRADDGPVLPADAVRQHPRPVVEAAHLARDRRAVVWRWHAVQGIHGDSPGRRRAVRRRVRLRVFQAGAQRAMAFLWGSVRVLGRPDGGDVVRSTRALRWILGRRGPVDVPAQPDGHDHAVSPAGGLAAGARGELRMAVGADASRRPAAGVVRDGSPGAHGRRAHSPAEVGLPGCLVLCDPRPGLQHRPNRHRSRRRAPHVPSPDCARRARGGFRVARPSARSRPAARSCSRLSPHSSRLGPS